MHVSLICWSVPFKTADVNTSPRVKKALKRGYYSTFMPGSTAKATGGTQCNSLTASLNPCFPTDEIFFKAVVNLLIAFVLATERKFANSNDTKGPDFDGMMSEYLPDVQGAVIFRSGISWLPSWTRSLTMFHGISVVEKGSFLGLAKTGKCVGFTTIPNRPLHQ